MLKEIVRQKFYHMILLFPVLYNPYKQLLLDACNICHLLFTVIDNNNSDKYMH